MLDQRGRGVVLESPRASLLCLLPPTRPVPPPSADLAGAAAHAPPGAACRAQKVARSERLGAMNRLRNQRGQTCERKRPRAGRGQKHRPPHP